MTKTLCGLLACALGACAQNVTVPLIVEGNAPIVELSFKTPAGAERKARFLVDTGGGSFMLGAKLMADIGAKTVGAVMESEGEKVQALAAPRVKLGAMDLNLSGVRVLGMPELVHTMSRNAVEGLFPAALLRKYEVVFDYPARQFTLAKPGSLQPRGVKLASPIGRTGFPRIELQVGGATYGFLLDSGASFTMISRVVLERWAKTNPAWPSETGAVGFANMFGGGMENGALMLRLPQLNLGTIGVKDAAAVSREDGTYEKYMSGMMTAPIVGALAGNVLRDFRVQIDYRNGFTWFERAGITEDFDLTSVGLVLAGAPDGTVVVTGISSKAAEDVKSGVRAGDKLVAVDDVKVTGKALAAVADALKGKAGEHKKLTIERAGASMVVTATVAVLL